MTDQQKAELAALAAMPEDEIDTSDIPEMPIDWANAKRGVFYGSIKQQVTPPRAHFSPAAAPNPGGPQCSKP